MTHIIVAHSGVCYYSKVHKIDDPKTMAMRESKTMSISGGRFLLFLFAVVSQIGLHPFCKTHTTLLVCYTGVSPIK